MGESGQPPGSSPKRAIGTVSVPEPDPPDRQENEPCHHDHHGERDARAFSGPVTLADSSLRIGLRI